MARVEIPPGVELPPICVKTGGPATDVFYGRVTASHGSRLSNVLSVLAVIIWPVAFCYLFLGPALLLWPYGSRIRLPVTRDVLWRFQIARYTGWFLFVGAIVTPFVPTRVVTGDVCADSFGIIAGALALLVAYIPAALYRLDIPSAKLRNDKASGSQSIILSRVHDAFAVAVADQRYAAFRVESGTVSSRLQSNLPIIAIALATSILVLGLIALLAFSATGGSMHACQAGASR